MVDPFTWSISRASSRSLFVRLLLSPSIVRIREKIRSTSASLHGIRPKMEAIVATDL
jgi:uncharacterized protein VirK/YbjX